ncbi:MAG: hypothetical protein AB1384_01355 [Actinomycetota bacterium]
MTLFMPVLLASLLFAGCGSADSGDYEHEVAEINRATSQKLEESLHLLGKEEHGEQEGQVEEEAHAEEETEGEGQVEEEEHAEEESQAELLVKALEEAVMILKEALLELEDVKVPAGMEDYHLQLASFYNANLAAYEGYLAALEPTAEHAGSEEEGSGSHDEESTGEEGAPQEGEAPHQEGEPAESAGH